MIRATTRMAAGEQQTPEMVVEDKGAASCFEDDFLAAESKGESSHKGQDTNHLASAFSHLDLQIDSIQLAIESHCVCNEISTQYLEHYTRPLSLIDNPATNIACYM